MAGQGDNKQDQDDITKNGTEPSSNGVDQTEDENIIEEYVMLDSKLDELNSALDYLEQKNDDIHEKLKELLQSNIEIRKQLRNENNMEVQEQN